MARRQKAATTTATTTNVFAKSDVTSSSPIQLERTDYKALLQLAPMPFMRNEATARAAISKIG